MNLTNKWMNNPFFLAQSAHFFGAIAIIMAATYLFGKTGGFIASGLLIILAAFKEFWYDMIYELPKQTWMDSISDFAFYMLGIGASCVLLFT